MARPPKPPPGYPKLSKAAKGFAAMYRPRDPRPFCPPCGLFVDDVPLHVAERHAMSLDGLLDGNGEILIRPIAELEGYTIKAHRPRPSARSSPETPAAPETAAAAAAAEGDEPVAEEPAAPTTRRRPTVLAEPIVTDHPGGDEGADLENLLARTERPFFRATIETLVRQGYGPMHLVTDLAYQMIQRRRLHVDIEHRRVASRGAVQDARTLALLKDVDDAILRVTQVLEKGREARLAKTDDPQEILATQLGDAERWVRANIGEFMTDCTDCGGIKTVSLPPLPHWAFERHQTKRGMEAAVWSPELWTLVLNGALPLHVMAFVLRTSPEGLALTARRRQEAWPTTIEIDREAILLRELKDRVGQHEAEEVPA